jgi:D-alanyl-D-alanine carboxypeptidase
MAVAIAETIDGSTDAFAQEMNGAAIKLGLTRTHYNNPNGLPDPGQVTTARDLAVLAIDLRRTFPQYDDIFRTQMVQVGKANLRTNNELLAKFEGTTGMKTGYVCGSGLNIVATVNRGGHELLAVLLGGSSARERDQRVAQLLLRGFAGEFKDAGKNVVTIVDDPNAPVMDMTPLLCGTQARAYVTAQVKQYPMGLKGQPSYLGDKITAQVYQATDLGPIGGPGPVLASGDNATQPAEGDAASDDDSPEGTAPAAAAPASDTTPAVPTVAPLPRTSQRRH